MYVQLQTASLIWVGNGPHGRHLTPVSVFLSKLEYYYSPLDGMLVNHRRPSIK